MIFPLRCAESMLSALSQARGAHIRTWGLCALAALSAGCDFGVVGSGDVTSKSVALEHFSELKVEDGFEVRITMGTEYRVVVRADDNIIDDVRVLQKDAAIRVTLDDLNVHDATLKVDVFVPELSKIHIRDGVHLEAHSVEPAGSLELVAQDGSELRLSTTKPSLAYLHLSCEDGSSCNVASNAEETIVELHDASTGILHGRSAHMTLLLSDASSMDAREFEVEQANVRIADASSGEVWVTETVQGTLTDASSLDISGDPEVDIETKGASSYTKR